MGGYICYICAIVRCFDHKGLCQVQNSFAPDEENISLSK